VDRNYWGDYSNRFPNATEIDNSGVWDTPYSHDGDVIDYHPLVKPVDISSDANPEVPDEQDSKTPFGEHFPTIWIAATAVVVGLGCLVYFVKFRKKLEKTEFLRRFTRQLRC